MTEEEEEEEECEQMLHWSSRSVWQWIGREGTPGRTEAETAGVEHGSGMLPAAHRYRVITVLFHRLHLEVRCTLSFLCSGLRLELRR